MSGHRVILTTFVLVSCFTLACARIPRNDAERQKDEEQLRRHKDSGIHTYYLLVKPPSDAASKSDKARSERLASEFHERLGSDKHVTITAASKVFHLFLAQFLTFCAALLPKHAQTRGRIQPR